MRRTSLFVAVLAVGLVVSGIVSAELYNRAPDVLPWIQPEMLTVGFWIDRMDNPDEVVMTVDEIKAMNERFEERIHRSEPFADLPEELKPDLSYWWPGHVLVMPDFSAMSPTAIADTVRSCITVESDYLREKPFGNALAVEYADWELDRFEKEMNFDGVPDRVTPQFGLAVRTGRLRNIPAFFAMYPGVRENAKTRWDLWTITILKIATPVTILHQSESGEYLFVATDEAYGWARSEDIAFGTSDQIEEFANPQDFYICTGDRVQFYSDVNCLYSSGLFRMGDRLPMVSIFNRNQVKVPIRTTAGRLTSETAYLRPDDNVHRGLLPFTRRNVVETAFKLLGNPYDWTGSWLGRQHETTYRDIFAVFGFKLPWHGALFTVYGGSNEVMKPEIGKEEQYRILNSHEPFLTLQSVGGHAQLYLGEYNGAPIVFDQHGYGYEADDGKYMEIRRTNIGDVRLPSYFLTRPVTFLKFIR